MPDKESLPAGFYTSANEGRRYWDGQSWLVPDRLPSEAAQFGSAEGEMLAGRPRAKQLLSGWAVRTKRRRIILVCVAVIVLAAGVGATALVYAVDTPQRESSALCETELLDLLKSPATAQVSEVQTLDQVEYQNYFVDIFASGLEDYPDLLEALEQDRANNIADARAEMASNAKEGITHLTVVGQVDSENGFSAMVHSAWTCEIYWEGTSVTDGPEVTVGESR